MHPDLFTEEEKKAMKSCVEAIYLLSFYNSSECKDIFELSKEEVKEVLDNYPNWDLYDESENGCDDSWLAINNSFAFLFDERSEVHKGMLENISFPIDFLREIYLKFKKI